MKPPALARWLLWAAAGEGHAEFVAGDLHEEFLILCATRGRPAGSRWYVWQVLRSVPWLSRMRFRSGEAAHVAAAMLAVALPWLLLDRLWRFVYSSIPLKDGLGRAPGFWAVSLVCVCLSAALCGSFGRSFPRAAAIAVAAAVAAIGALWCGTATVPAVYAGLAILAAPASSLAGFQWRRMR
jgi:hypothetical protein